MTPPQRPRPSAPARHLPDTADRAPDPVHQLVGDLTRRSPEVALAVLLSTEGLALSAAGEVTGDDAERLAALASSLASLTRSAANAYSGGRVDVTTVDLGRRHLCLMPVDEGTSLLFAVDGAGDLGQVMYESARTADALADALDGFTGNDPWRMFLDSR